MNPNVLRDLVRDTIEYYIADREAWDRCARNQVAEQASLQTALDAWQALKI